MKMIYSAISEDRNLVSVIIPIYNAEDHLKETLDSVVSQTHSPFEIIVVDDGSTDGSVDILRQFGSRITLIQQENKGVAAARNAGAHHANGYWIAFLDADDIWFPSKIEKQLEVCKNYDWSYTNAIFLGGVNDGKCDSLFTKKHQGNVLRKLALGNFISTSSVIMKRQLFINTGGFDESLRSIQDWDFWTRLSVKYAIGYVPEPLVKYRVHSNSISRKTRNTLTNHLLVIDKLFAFDGPAYQYISLKPLAKAKSCSTCSYIAEEEGDTAFALHAAFLACRYEPTTLNHWIRMGKAFLKHLILPIVPLRKKAARVST